MPTRIAKSFMRAFVMKAIRDQEQARGVGLDYLKWIVENAWPSFKLYRKLLVFGSYRVKLPLEAYHWVRIITTEYQNMQSCRETERQMALKAGLSASWVNNCMTAAHTRDFSRIEPDLIDLSNFVGGLENHDLEPALREKILKQYGPEALMEIGWVYLACYSFPMLKRLIGKE